MKERTLTLVLAIAFIASAFQGQTVAASYDASKIDPALLGDVLADDRAEYDVIVRSAEMPGASKDRPTQAKDELTRAGGSARFALGIIGGTAGRIRGKQLLALTNSRRVDYVYADVALRSAWTIEGDGYKATSPAIKSVRAPQAWQSYGVSGRGISVAVLDSGVAAHPDLGKRVVAAIDMLSAAPVVSTTPLGDPGGHGTHVAGLIAGDGTSSGGKITGAAPEANIVDVRVIRADGTSNASLVLRGMQWILTNRAAYNIRVLNLSLGAPVRRSYRIDPLAAGAEILTFAGITVVTSAGNGGSSAATITTPANDPYVISVAAIDDAGTSSTSDDTIAPFSARGLTPIDGLAKPDVAAPGRRVVSLRAAGSTLDTQYPERRETGGATGEPSYFRLSGTSMAAPIVAGTVALILQKSPGLRPDQIKKRLRATADPLSKYTASDQGAGRIDAVTAVGWSDTSRGYAAGRPADAFAKDVRGLLYGQRIVWKDLRYNGGVDSNNNTWENVTWENVTWDNVTWENVTWESFTWENVTWENVTWENVTWENTTWENNTWEGATWDAARLD